MLLIEARVASSDPNMAAADVNLILPFELRQKSRLRTRLANGEEVGIFLERGSMLRDGDLLQANDGRIVQVVAADEEIMRVETPDPYVLARCAYHLGNRHVPVQVGAGWLALQRDHVLCDMLVGLGVQVSEALAPFEPEAGAYTPAHEHAAHPGRGRIIGSRHL